MKDVNLKLFNLIVFTGIQQKGDGKKRELYTKIFHFSEGQYKQ